MLTLCTRTCAGYSVDDGTLRGSDGCCQGIRLEIVAILGIVGQDSGLGVCRCSGVGVDGFYSFSPEPGICDHIAEQTFLLKGNFFLVMMHSTIAAARVTVIPQTSFGPHFLHIAFSWHSSSILQLTSFLLTLEY